MPLSESDHYTIYDIYALPDGKRAELVDGQLYDMAPPGTMHQRLVMNLSGEIREYIRSHHGICEVFPAPFAVFLSNDDKTYVEPDISVICDPDKLDDRGCNGPPDWIIEIVSPGSTRMDYFIKLFKYRTSGVREYWIVNPLHRTVQTYTFVGDEDSNQFSFDDCIKVQIYKDFELKISDLL